jgi:hypothetical protein
VSSDGVLTLVLIDARPEPTPPPLPFVKVEEFAREGNPERLGFNGFTAFIQRGTAKVDGRPMAVDFILLTHRLRKFSVSGWAFAPEKSSTASAANRCAAPSRPCARCIDTLASAPGER